MAIDGTNKTITDRPDSNNRQTIAMIVLISSIGGILLLALVIMIGSCWYGKDCSYAKELFNALLPLFGTWVGTLLAFYFSKDNFEAATRSVENMANKISAVDERLQQIPVKDKMRAMKDIDSFVIKRGEESNCILSKLLDDKKHERIPMMDDTGRMVYLVYKATVNQFLSQLALGKIKAGDKTPANVSLGDAFLADPKLKDIFEKSFGFVPQTASLSDAQREMERVSKTAACNDIFVTAAGKPDEAVLGWITDNTISENLRV